VNRAASQRLSALLVLLFVAAWVARNEATDTFGQYGDYYQLVNLMQTEDAFPRWLIGTEVLRGAYRLAHYLQDTTPLSFVLQASKGWHLVAGIAILIAFPSWAAFLALTSPLLLHFGSGYSEYYPFVAPLFVAVALGHVNGTFDELKPWAVGAGCALLVMFYVGFLPLALIVAGQALLRDRSQAPVLLATGATTGLAVALLLAGPGFFTTLLADLNMGDVPAHPEQDGWAIPGTPFFWPGRAIEHLPAFAGAISRAVGIGPMLAGLALSLRDRRLAVLVWTYTVVSIFTIPRLGMLGDTDLYFQLYALAGLSIGWALDAGSPEAASRRAANESSA
jgi:hypothetical protein